MDYNERQQWLFEMCSILDGGAWQSIRLIWALRRVYPFLRYLQEETTNDRLEIGKALELLEAFRWHLQEQDVLSLEVYRDIQDTREALLRMKEVEEIGKALGVWQGFSKAINNNNERA